MGDIKSSIKKMSNYAASTSSNGKDSLIDGTEAGVVTNNNMETDDHSFPDPHQETMKTPKNQGQVELPTFKKKVKHI